MINQTLTDMKPLFSTSEVKKRTYPYYGKWERRNFGKVGSVPQTKIVRFEAPTTGVQVEGAERGKFSKRWSEWNFTPIDYKEDLK